jgi:hypothetical protein
MATRAVPAARSQAAGGGGVADGSPGPAPTRIVCGQLPGPARTSGEAGGAPPGGSG